MDHHFHYHQNLHHYLTNAADFCFNKSAHYCYLHDPHPHHSQDQKLSFWKYSRMLVNFDILIPFMDLNQQVSMERDAKYFLKIIDYSWSSAYRYCSYERSSYENTTSSSTWRTWYNRILGKEMVFRQYELAHGCP